MLLPVVQQQPLVTPRDKASLKQHLVKVGPDVPDIRRNKQTDREKCKKYRRIK